MARYWWGGFKQAPAEATPEAVSEPFRYGRPETLTASAERLTASKVDRWKPTVQQSWQDEAWDALDQVGELRYLANAIANRMSNATLYVEHDGVKLENPEEDPLLKVITPQLIEHIGLNLYIAGEAYLIGVPDEMGAVEWDVLSTREVDYTARGLSIRGESADPDDVFLLRIWDPHPAWRDDADSPVRASLPVLRELIGLTQHVSAQIDSRLAGAGIYWLPNSILSANTTATNEGGYEYSDNPVIESIMQAMLTPIKDRSNASAVVPLINGAPDDAIGKIRFDTFHSPLDGEARELRNEAIRRLSLGLDAPPELLLGQGDASYFGAWLHRDEIVQGHIKPRLNLIADALTTGFYQPILEQQGVRDADAYVVRFDVTELVQRPNRLADANTLYQAGVISDAALREAGGFQDEDAPPMGAAIKIALQIVQDNPQMLDNIEEVIGYLNRAFELAGLTEEEADRQVAGVVAEAEAQKAAEAAAEQAAANAAADTPSTSSPADADAE